MWRGPLLRILGLGDQVRGQLCPKQHRISSPETNLKPMWLSPQGTTDFTAFADSEADLPGPPTSSAAPGVISCSRLRKDRGEKERPEKAVHLPFDLLNTHLFSLTVRGVRDIVPASVLKEAQQQRQSNLGVVSSPTSARAPGQLISPPCTQPHSQGQCRERERGDLEGASSDSNEIQRREPD